MPSSANGSHEAAPTNHSLLLAHVVCGALTAMLFIPITILVPRIARGFTTHRWWFPIHATSASLSLILGIATYAIAQSGLGDGASHGDLGTALFALLIAQAILGPGMALYNHFRSRRNPTIKSRHPINYVHIAVGLATVAVGWAAVYTGWSTQWPKPDDSGTGPIGKGYQVAYWLIVAVVAAVYLAGVVFLLPRQIKKEKALRAHRESVQAPLVGEAKPPAAVSREM